MNNQNPWMVVDNTYNAIPGVTRATTVLNRVLAPERGQPVALLPKYQGHIEKAWMIGMHELVVCTKVISDSGKQYRYALYTTIDVKGFYLQEIAQIMDSYIRWTK